MNSEIMETILTRLDKKMKNENQKVILFWDTATIGAGLLNIKLVFLPKNTTSRLQPLDEDIIRNFTQKYRKLLVKYVGNRIGKGRTASQVIEDVHVLRAITWLQTAWKSVSPETIQHRFKKCDFDVVSTPDLIDQVDKGFEDLFKQLSSEATLDEYIDFDAGIITSEPDTDLLNVDWRQDPREKSIRDVVNAHGEHEANSESHDETATADLPTEIDTASLTASGAIRRLDEVKQFVEVHGYNDLNMALNDLIGRFEALNRVRTEFSRSFSLSFP